MIDTVHTFSILAVSLCTVITVNGAREETGNDTVCYDQLGCFYLGYPWSPSDSELYYVPQHPDEIDVKFYLTSRFNNRSSRLDKWDMNVKTDFNSDAWTYFIIHGYYSSSSVDWIFQMEQALVDKKNVNVIIVDWSKGCSGLNYFQAVSNTRVVAAIITKLINRLIDDKKMSASRIHMIGHSLGAHLSSYVGFHIPGIARITGLDPSLPGFTIKEDVIRLDPQDAEFVEVVHTNAGTFGHGDPLGHVDFYVNGGSSQPGCSLSELRKSFSSGLIMEYVKCSHSRAQIYYIESIISSCIFWGRPWNFTGEPDLNEPCDEKSCQIVGLKSAELPGRGVYYVATNDNAPYCQNETVSGITQSEEDSKRRWSVFRRRKNKRKQSKLQVTKTRRRSNRRCKKRCT